MRADLGHQKHALPPILDRLPHPRLTLAVVVFPCIVEKRDARVDRFVDEPCGLSFGADFPDVKATEPKCRHGVEMTAERPPRDLLCAHTTRICKRRTIRRSFTEPSVR